MTGTARSFRYEREAARARRRKRERILRGTIVALLCAGVLTQTVLIVRLAGKTRQAAQIEAEIDQLSADAVNYRLTIGSNGDRTMIRRRAVDVLGMVEPGEDQIRVVRVPIMNAGDTQLVMNETAGTAAE